MKKWIVDMFYQGKREGREQFDTREEAMQYFERQVAACRFGLVGWSVSYPKELVGS